MRTALLIISSLVAVFFAVAFGATFFAKGHITRLAEDYVIDRTERYADPLVQITEQAVNAPGIERLLDADIVRTVRRELAEYRRDSRAYIAQLVVANGGAPAVNPGPDAPLKDQMLFWKAEIRAHFDKTLNRLLFDLRIFTASNLVAAALAFGLAYMARRDRLPRLLLVAGLLLASVAFTSYVYVDELSYFKILMNSYMGWWYPALLALTFLGAFVEHGRVAVPKSDSTGTK